MVPNRGWATVLSGPLAAVVVVTAAVGGGFVVDDAVADPDAVDDTAEVARSFPQPASNAMRTKARSRRRMPLIIAARRPSVTAGRGQRRGRGQ